MSPLPYNINSIDWGKLSDIKFLSEIKPPKQFDYAFAFFYLFLALTILAISLMVLSSKLSNGLPPRKKFFRNAWLTLFIESLLGFMLLLSRLYQIPFISSRLWLVALIVIIFSMAIYLSDYYRKILPGDIKKYKEEQLRLKYLPKKKKK